MNKYKDGRAEEINNLLKGRGLSLFDTHLIQEPNSRAIIEEYYEKSKGIFKGVSKQMKTKDIVVEICMTDSLSIDIFVSPLKQKNNYLLGISYGTFANLYACFAGLMAHPGVLPHIGNPQNTHCRYDFVDYGLMDFTYEHDAIREYTPVSEGIPLWHYPKDEERILYALLLLDMALQFILYHEWGHIIGGHLSFLNTHHIHGMGENENRGGHNLPYLIGDDPIRKVMEFEADYIAARILSAQPYYLNITNRTFFQAFPDGFLGKYNVGDAIFFAVLSVFHLLDEIRRKNKWAEPNLYPATYYRFCSLLYCIYDETNEAHSFWKNYDYKGVADFVKTTQTLRFDYSFRKYAYSKKATDRELVKLDEQLEQIRQYLGKYRLD